VLAVADRIRQSVLEKFGVALEASQLSVTPLRTA